MPKILAAVLVAMAAAPALAQVPNEPIRDFQVLSVQDEGIEFWSGLPIYSVKIRYTVPANAAFILAWAYDGGPLTATSLGLDEQGSHTRLPEGAHAESIQGMVDDMAGAQPGSIRETTGYAYLTPGRTYWWVLQASDGATLGPLSNNVYCGPDTTVPPAPLIAATSGSPELASISWNAPANGIYLYDFRYSSAPITDAGFETAATLGGLELLPTPSSGSAQSCTVVVPPGTWHIACKAVNTTIHSSPISNVVTVSVAKLPPPPRFEGPGADGGTPRNGSGGCSAGAIPSAVLLLALLPLLAGAFRT